MNNWLEIFSVILELDPSIRQRKREVKLGQLYYEPASTQTGREMGALSEEWTDFCANWLAENVPGREAKALADCIGRGLTLREASEEHGVDVWRIAYDRKRLARAVKEAM